MWNFFDLVHELGIPIHPIENAPRTCGFYMLFADDGTFIYVGKADNLRERLREHFSDDEPNERIRGIAHYAIWCPTDSLEAAEEAEGSLYDRWIGLTGLPPFANKKKPPKSTQPDEVIRRAKLYLFLELYRYRWLG